ncbi:isochorismatase family protein [Methylosinus sporium]|uniref:isochorismatase family protein n=1 Tax=Methylosinus sporium TaxID=428 RepID=UPI00383A32D9
MSASDAALVVVDAQESFRRRPYWRDDDAQPFVGRLQALIDGAKAAAIPVVQVFHVADSGPFAKNSGFVRTLEPLAIAPDAIFRKRRHSGLDVWLIENGVRRLIVSGIRTEQCCETTTRHASDLGYAVDFVGEATLTFPMANAAGREWSSAEIRARTELALAGRFARIATVEEALLGRPEEIAA